MLSEKKIKMEEKLKHYQRFFLQIKRLARNQGRSSIIPIFLIDELINEYFIEGDLKDVEIEDE